MLKVEVQEDPNNMEANFSNLAYKEDDIPLYGRSPYVLAFINLLIQTGHHEPN